MEGLFLQIPPKGSTPNGSIPTICIDLLNRYVVIDMFIDKCYRTFNLRLSTQNIECVNVVVIDVVHR